MPYLPALLLLRPAPFSPPPELTEFIRLLLLPLPEVHRLHERAAAWKPGKPLHLLSLPHSLPTTTAGVSAHQHADGNASAQRSANTVNHSKQPTSTPAAGTSSSHHTVIDPGPVSGELAARVRAVACRVAAHMQGRYTCSLEEDERWVGAIREHDVCQQQQLRQDEQVAQQQQQQREEGGGRKRKGGGGSAQGSSKKEKVEVQQQQGQQEQDTPSLPPRFRAAVVARVGEKRCLAALRAWWEGGSNSSGSIGGVQGNSGQEQQQGALQQEALQRVVADHVARVWSAPRVGMRGVRRPGAVSESEEEGEGDSEGSSEWESDQEAKGAKTDQQQQQQRDKGEGGRGLAVGSAAVGGEAQAAATLSRPNLAHKQHFAFGFSL